jgi:hypothetical protein
MIREGGCHCGNHLRLTQRLSRPPWEIQRRRVAVRSAMQRQSRVTRSA